MKYESVLFILLVMSACSDPDSSGKNSGNIKEDVNSEIPVAAKREKFDDNPEVERITVRNSVGVITTEGILFKGVKEGTWTEFGENGIAKMATPYLHGKKEGVYLEFNANGQFIKRIGFHNNIRNGVYVEYYNQNKKEERTYSNGQLEGLVKIYYPDGKIMEESNYKNDTRDGVSKWYDNAGNVTINYEYKNGELIKK